MNSLPMNSFGASKFDAPDLMYLSEKSLLRADRVKGEAIGSAAQKGIVLLLLLTNLRNADL